MILVSIVRQFLNYIVFVNRSNIIPGLSVGCFVLKKNCFEDRKRFGKVLARVFLRTWVLFSLSELKRWLK